MTVDQELERPAKRRGGCKPRMSGCAASCLHKQLVETYRAAQHADWSALEAETMLYEAEVREYRETRPALTFRAWLEGSRQDH